MKKKLIVLSITLLLLLSSVFITIKLDDKTIYSSKSQVLALTVEETTTTTTTVATTTTEVITTTNLPTTTTTKTTYVSSYYQNIINNAYYNILPNKIRNKLTEYNVKLEVTTDSKAVEKRYGYKSAIAVSDYQNRIILIEAANNQFTKNSLYRWGVDSKTVASITEDEAVSLILENNVLHESGHMLDSLYSFNYSTYMHDIRLREQSSYAKTTAFKIAANNSKANINSDEEYFATIFSSYLTFNEELKNTCPESYEYIDNIMKEFTIL